MPFRYLCDPLFVVCIVAYFVNRWLLKRVWTDGFVHEHFNDLICIPFWVPIMLFLEKKTGWRKIDAIPQLHEILIPLVIWSWVFEIVLPNTETFRSWCVSDHEDVLFYTVGAFAAAFFWRWNYRERHTRAPSNNPEK